VSWGGSIKVAADLKAARGLGGRCGARAYKVRGWMCASKARHNRLFLHGITEETRNSQDWVASEIDFQY